MFANTTHSIQSIAQYETLIFEMTPTNGTTQKTPNKKETKIETLTKLLFSIRVSCTIPLF